MDDLSARLADLRRDFPSFLKENNDFHHGRVLCYRDAEPGSTPSKNLCSGPQKRGMTMGVMFHGTHRDNVAPICRDGISRYSSFTSSLHYAVRRSEFKEGYKNDTVEVLAMAVLVDEASKLEGKDEWLKEPYYSLPMFVVTISVS